MTYLLDTSGVSGLMREDAGISSWLSSVPAQERVVICPIVRGGSLYGLGRRAPERRRAELEAKAEKLFADATLVSRDTDFKSIAGLALISL